jgi:hypothetical protein
VTVTSVLLIAAAFTFGVIFIIWGARGMAKNFRPEKDMK